MGYVLKTTGSVVPRMRRENATSKRQRKNYRFKGENEREENESMDPFCRVRAQLSQVKERRSPLRLNVFGRERQRHMVPGIQERENRVQLGPGKGYLIGNESE